jgi:2-dehydropantoate 2-reductase
VGCTLLARLAETGRCSILVAARTGFTTLEVKTPTGVITRQPAVLTSPDQVTAPVDWIMLATKTYDVASAISWLEQLAGPSTRIAILQNGVEHLDRLPSSFPRDRLVPAVVDCPAERLAPGRVRHYGTATITVPDDAPGRAFVDLFAGTGVQVATTQDWKTAAWKKLCLNAAGAVSAASLRPAGVVHFPPAAALMRSIVGEVIRVGRAEGAVLEDSLVDSIVEREARAPRDAVNSILADRRAGRRTEADARNGVIVRLGRKHGIPTPYNEALTAILLAAQE